MFKRWLDIDNSFASQDDLEDLNRRIVRVSSDFEDEITSVNDEIEVLRASVKHMESVIAGVLVGIAISKFPVD